jgi:1-aminocyclopropane-1-carboxylate deaminase/D-cysteine desulfhydrase-like pyridoxal-dependent ACC family enzyme
MEVRGARAVGALLRTLSPYESTSIAGRNIFVKRLDSIDYMGLSGNKSFKLLNVTQMVPFPQHLASMGGCQGNLMLAVARLISSRNTHFGGGYSATYFTRSIPQHLKSMPNGNYATALSLGLKVCMLCDSLLLLD